MTPCKCQQRVPHIYHLHHNPYPSCPHIPFHFSQTPLHLNPLSFSHNRDHGSQANELNLSIQFQFVRWLQGFKTMVTMLDESGAWLPRRTQSWKNSIVFFLCYSQLSCTHLLLTLNQTDDISLIERVQYPRGW